MSYHERDMNKNTEAKGNTPSEQIPLPNLRDQEAFDGWLRTYITRPFQGFEAKTHPDGKSFSFDEQVKATRQQIRDLVGDFSSQRQPPLEEVLRTLMGYAYKNRASQP